MKSLYVVLAAALAVIGFRVTAGTASEADDAPGLALIGIVLIVGAFPFAVRAAYRAGSTHGTRI
jgi:hypothetical protein